ncbi:EF-hand domain-containing family member B [Paragonimus heterotremus]|uniref:EF-hand domain-containing family member B n=1 Tax=Paragonimus heterotremus TaxID=100268 RepID=A0A8J4TLR8_9TREM|nr:EF-hand domain-containing family member B [Paragonimus heterotremus]
MVLFEELKRNIPSKEKSFCVGTKYIDRFCDLVPAGDSGIRSKMKMKHCLEHLKPSPTPDPVKRWNSWNNTKLEEKRIFHAIVNDKQLEDARTMCHGIQSKDRTQIRELICPKEPSSLEALRQSMKEEIYDSYKRKPLGMCPEPNLPKHIDQRETVFGRPNIPVRYHISVIQTQQHDNSVDLFSSKDEGAAPLLNPRRSRAELLREEAADRRQFIVSHKHLIAGEQGQRRYENFDKNKVFGMQTHCDPRGILVSRALNWFSNTQVVNQTPVMSRGQFDFKQRYDHHLGRTRDPIADTMNVPEGHVFGLSSKRGELTVGQLLHGKIPRQLAGLPFDNLPEPLKSKQSECVSYVQRLQELVPVIHHALQEARFWRGAEITAALCHLAKGADHIPMIDARELFRHFEVPLDEELTEQMFDVVKVRASDEMVKSVRERLDEKRPSNQVVDRIRMNAEDFIHIAVDWRLMATFLDWKRHAMETDRLKACGCLKDANQISTERQEVADAVRRRLRRAIEANLLTYHLTSEQYGGNSSGLVNSDCWIRLGKPPVEREKPVPKVRSVHNATDYGDEPNVRSVIQPNIYAEYGLSQRDLLILRTQEEIRSILENAGLSDQVVEEAVFQQIWEKAVKLDKSWLKELASTDGKKVSMQAFKEALFEVRGKEICKMVDQEYTNRCC